MIMVSNIVLLPFITLCHMKGVYIGALSYADDITILSPSIGGLNEMLKICHIFAEKNSI